MLPDLFNIGAKLPNFGYVAVPTLTLFNVPCPISNTQLLYYV